MLTCHPEKWKIKLIYLALSFYPGLTAAHVVKLTAATTGKCLQCLSYNIYSGANLGDCKEDGKEDTKQLENKY